MVEQSLGQADALIKRLMEGLGGSADAYEECPKSTGLVVEEVVIDVVVEEEDLVKDTPDADDQDLLGDDEDLCITGDVDWDEVGNRVWTNPPPITDEYTSAGVVEDCDELLVIYEGFEEARSSGQPQLITLETGSYEVVKPSSSSNWRLQDTVKDRFYAESHPAQYLGVVDEQDLFIWVTPGSEPCVDLGYIHMGYIFTRK